MKIGFDDKFQHLEDIVTKLSDAVLFGKGGDNCKQAERSMFYSKLTKLEFPTYHGDEDPTEWFTKVDQFFKYQGTSVTQKVSLASYHLQVLFGKGGENCKQAERSMFYSKLTKLEFPTYHSDEDPTEWFTKVDQFFKYQGTSVTQKVSLALYHLQELWSRFGPTDCEDFDEALSNVQQTGPFREYQKEFESVGHKCKGPQLLVLESALDEGDCKSFVYQREP
nr:hypothetical protein [Tanacetum cinerariifolium]